MTDDSKKDPNEDSTEPVLEFGNSDLDLEMEKPGNVVANVEAPSSGEGIELSFGDDADLSFSFSERTEQAAVSSVPVEEKPELAEANEAVEFSDVEADSSEDNEVVISPDLQEDLDSFKTTHKDYVPPVKPPEEEGNIEFVATTQVNAPDEHTVAIANAIAAATANLTEVVNEFKNVQQHQVEQNKEEKEEGEEDFEFSIGGDEPEYASASDEINFEESTRSEEQPKSVPAPVAKEAARATDVVAMKSSTDLRGDVEIQATLRQVREEREDLLKQFKEAKNLIRDLEQDNLTLKSALDESKIEISILRKRHLTELEDLKYRLMMSEDKKMLAEERTKALASQKEKLEQKVRIDLNQVKQREKELETKLEMLSMDVDAQVQSRDQKILELRRKIDSLEFNMENVSIREQKTSEDKRKIEDKLNKIMKTLRSSIKNLEDDVDAEIVSSKDSSFGKNK